jgi:peptidoglycan/LPS O-acetylase OafA/YrhL
MRFNNLTVARFVAAVLVFLHHSTANEYTALQATKSDHLLRFVHNGYVGVSFFFTVSGFVLAASSLDRLADLSVRRSLSFYWKRIARIVPLWLVVSSPLIYWAVKNHRPEVFPFLSFTQAWYSDINVALGLLGVAWTLSVEAFFYLAFPFLAALLKPFRSRRTGPAVVLIGLAIPTLCCWYFSTSPDLKALPPLHPNGSHFWLYRFPPSRIGEFIAGIGIYLCVSRGVIRLSKWSAATIMALACGALVCEMVTTSIYDVYYVFPDAIFFSVIVAMLAHIEVLGIAVRSRAFILMGESSFAFYLVHQYYFKGYIAEPILALGGVWVSLGFVLVITIATSIGFFLMVETPCREFLLGLLRVRSTIPTSRPVALSTAQATPESER